VAGKQEQQLTVRSFDKHPRRTGADGQGPDDTGLSGLALLWKRAANEAVAAEAIYTTLREAILSGVLAPGDRLGEEQLARLFKRSRTPVREAIFRLESERLTQRATRRGFVVGGMTHEQVLDVYAVRATLDGLAARLAAHAMLPVEIDRLRWLNAEMRHAAECEQYVAILNLNIQFHEAICRASRNSVVVQFMGQIHDWVRRFPETTLSYPTRAFEAIDEHDRLIDAFSRRAPEEAEHIALAHMEKALHVRVAMLQVRRDVS
jgi:DNA-binding GntR family transcriptional regulator